MKQIIITLILVGLILISGCTNSFNSCHERCMEIEKLKLDNGCDTFLSDTDDVIEECNITQQQIINYKEECFNKCLHIKD